MRARRARRCAVLCCAVRAADIGSGGHSPRALRVAHARANHRAHQRTDECANQRTAVGEADYIRADFCCAHARQPQRRVWRCRPERGRRLRSARVRLLEQCQCKWCCALLPSTLISCGTCQILSCDVKSCLVVSCRVVSCPSSTFHVLASCPVLSRPFCPLVSCCIASASVVFSVLWSRTKLTPHLSLSPSLSSSPAPSPPPPPC